MSEPVYENPPGPVPPGPPLDLAYQTPPPWGNAPLLVRLAAIFTLVSAGFDVLYAIISGSAVAFMHYAFTHIPPMPPPAPGAPPVPAPVPPPLPPMLLIYGMYGIPGVLCLLVLGFKIYGALKLLRPGPRSWGWGLAVAIIGCTQFWMILLCCVMSIIPVSAGVYSLIILCLPHVRQYLRFSMTPQQA